MENEDPGFVFIAEEQQAKKGTGWILDSGATRHITNRRELLFDFVEYAKPQSVRIGDNRMLSGVGKGSVKLKSGERIVTFTDVLLVPDMALSLLSVSQLDAKGIEFMVAKGAVIMLRGDGLELAKAHKAAGLYHIEGEMLLAAQGSGGQLSLSPWQPLP